MNLLEKAIEAGFSISFGKICEINFNRQIDITHKLEKFSELIQPQWIKCSDRLPEKDMRVTLCTRSGYVCDGYLKNRVDNKTKQLFTDGYGTVWYVTHWMPLPQPPKD